MKEKIFKEGRRGMSIKRMLSVVLVLVMAITLLPINCLTVYATTPSDITLGTPVFSSTTECTVPVTVTGSVKTLSVAVTNAKLKLNSVSGTGYTFKNAVVSSSLCDSTPIANKEYLSVQLVVDNATAAQTALAGIKYCSITSDAEVKMSADTVSLASGDYYINGHYYTLKDNGAMSWKQAMEWAFNLQSNSTYSAKYPGYKSYPAVITSAEENQMLVNIWYNNGNSTHRQIFLPAVPVSPDGGSISVNGMEGNRTVNVTGDPYCSDVYPNNTDPSNHGHGEVYKWMDGTPEAGTTLPYETQKPFKFWDWQDPNPTNGGMVYFGHPGHGAYWDDLTEGENGVNNWTVTKNYDSTWHFCALAEWEPTDSAQMIVKTKALKQPGVCKIGETEYLTVDAALKGAANNASTIPLGETAENPTVITMIANSTERITIPLGRTITLDLNGYVLNGGCSGSDYGIVITNCGTLTITDSNSGNQTHNFKVDANGLWTLTNDAATVEYENIATYPVANDIVALKGGCITGGKRDAGDVSAGVLVDGGTLTLSSGSIVGNYCGAGPGVTVQTNGTLNMIGGKITGNMANNPAAGILIAGGTVNLSGGDVSYNVANATGNGIMVNGSGGLVSVLNMTGGRIIGNHTHFVTKWAGEKNYDYGGGVAIYDAGQMVMTGGTITKNNSKDKGGGVGFEGTGGQLTLGGSASITGNTKKDGTTASNLYLPSGTTVKVSEEAPLASGSTINVTTQSVPSKGNPVAITSPGTVDNSSFFSFSPENANYKIYNKIDNNNKQYVVLSVHEHNWSYKAEGNVIKAYCTEEFGTTNCDHFGVDNAATITLSATSSTYSGSEVTYCDDGTNENATIKLSGKSVWEGAGAVAPGSITYYKSTGADSIEESGDALSTAPSDAGNYIAEISVTNGGDTYTAKKAFSILRAVPSVSVAPTAKSLVYNGSEQELINIGSSSNGVIKYSISQYGISQAYSETIPTGKNAGKYYVYYMIAGNVNIEDKYYDTPVEVTISKAEYSVIKTVSGNVLAVHESVGAFDGIPDIPEDAHMTYGSPVSASNKLSDLSVAGGKLLYKGSSGIEDGEEIEVTIPVVEVLGENANYDNYNITVTLIGQVCNHDAPNCLEWSDELPSTCLIAGTKEHYKCNICNTILDENMIEESDEAIIIPALGHDWHISADKNKIIASCSRKEECNASDRYLTLNAATKFYDGSAAVATISQEEKDIWIAETVNTEVLTVPTIQYLGTGSTTYNSETAPVEVGSYEARISYDIVEGKNTENETTVTVTASAPFAILRPALVRLDPNGGVFDREVKSFFTEIGKPIVMPEFNISNSGMIFRGWYKDEHGEEKWNVETDIVTEDMTLYAHWSYPAGIEKTSAEMCVDTVRDYHYTGRKIEPVVRVYLGEKLLTENIDYTVSYKNNIKAATGVVNNNLSISEDGSIDYSKVDQKKWATIIIMGKGNYKNKAAKLNFNILPLSLGSAGSMAEQSEVSADITSVYAKNSKATISVKPVIKYNGKKLNNKKDYSLELVAVEAKDKSGNVIEAGTVYKNQKLPKGVSGSFKLSVEGCGNYDGGFYKIITVAENVETLQKAKITVKKIPYLGRNLEIEDVINTGNLKVKIGKKELVYGQDYTVEFSGEYKSGNRTSAQAYPIVITGIGSYTGSRMRNVVLMGASIKKASVKLKDENPVYNGSHIGANIESITVAVTENGQNTEKALILGKDYVAKVSNDVKAGKASVQITGIGAYSGSKKIRYRIAKKQLTADMLAGSSADATSVNLGEYEYLGGIAVIPKANIYHNGNKLISPTDYTVTARKNKKAGAEAEAVITGKGNYMGKINCSFKVLEDKIDKSKENLRKVKAKINNQVYSGDEITINQESFKYIKIKVKENGKSITKDLELNKDFIILENSYQNNVDKTSKASVTIKGINGYDGYKVVNFKIVKKDLKWWQK